MIRRNHKKMSVGWVLPTIGTFGAVREVIEVSNVLVRKGYRVIIYHPDGTKCKWLECLAECRKLTFLPHDPLDVLIGVVDWKTDLYNDVINAPAKVKAICLLGFEPTEQMARALRGEEKPQDEAQRIIRDAMARKMLLLADSNWQVEWIKKRVEYTHVGPSFGGINLAMFYPPAKKKLDKPVKIIYSGDPRERKGTDIVEKAIEFIQKAKNLSEIEFDSYWGKRYSQEQLVNFIQSGDIFLDGHRRAGWCNPVAEAMACGVVPVCTAIGANRDFALHNRTSLVVGVDDAEKMAEEASLLIGKADLRQRMSMNGLKHIQNFSYEKVVPKLELALKERLGA